MLKGTTRSGFAFEIPDARCRCLPVHCKKPRRLVSDAGVDRLIFRFEGNKQTLAFSFIIRIIPPCSRRRSVYTAGLIGYAGQESSAARFLITAEAAASVSSYTTGIFFSGFPPFRPRSVSPCRPGIPYGQG